VQVGSLTGKMTGASLIRILLALPVLMLAAACTEDGAPPAQAETTGASRSAPAGSGFDFYVLALSWSPAYCLIEGDRANRQQCDLKTVTWLCRAWSLATIRVGLPGILPSPGT
jgi:ribonuclease I